ncbi:hypothetical protein RhiirC2_783463 [Rhizophagus irregularis]|uniref:Uncharacterized protein n=1 Tax=Rhizophagus irregularis TaxID=588596 RepID=A0A2N1N0R3_9GLOM|nr:hypothetical protein RhiirC2_783463 [Rhizophagus irregularis]
MCHFTAKIEEAGDNANCDYSTQINRITSLSCWSFSSGNWSSYSLVCGCLPSAFLEVFESLDIPRLTVMNEHAMNITSKLKNSSRPKSLPKSSCLPYSSLPPSTYIYSRDSETDWLKNSMQCGLSWFNHISDFMGCLTHSCFYFGWNILRKKI